MSLVDNTRQQGLSKVAPQTNPELSGTQSLFRQAFSAHTILQSNLPPNASVLPIAQNNADLLSKYKESTTECLSTPATGITKNTQRFDTMDEAAIEAIKAANPLSIIEYREFGGHICEKDGTFSYTHPNRGTAGCVRPSTCPPEEKTVADYHTHGGPTTKFTVEDFSSQDILANELSKQVGYLGTPSGDIKKYTPTWNIQDGLLYPAESVTIETGAKQESR